MAEPNLLRSQFYDQLTKEMSQRALVGQRYSPYMPALLPEELRQSYATQAEHEARGTEAALRTRQLNIAENAASSQERMSEAQLGTTAVLGGAYLYGKYPAIAGLFGKGGSAIGTGMGTGGSGAALSGTVGTPAYASVGATGVGAETFGTGASLSGAGAETFGSGTSPALASQGSLTTGATTGTYAGAGYAGIGIGAEIGAYAGNWAANWTGEKIGVGGNRERSGVGKVGGGILGGMAAGAAIGSVVPGFGTAVGGVIGAVVGAIDWLMNDFF
jgi:hypothetical protein